MASEEYPLNQQETIRVLADYWAGKGCMLGQPINTEVGAGTLNPATFLRVLGPEPWRSAYVEPSVRPDDSRYGENPNRMQTHTQFQVILKPEPGNAQDLYLESLNALGIDATIHDIRFVEDNWESPAFGAWGLGWEVWLNGLEITQFTYFQQSGSVTLDPVPVEITYGIERILMATQGVTHFRDIEYAPGLTYDFTHAQAEYEFSIYYLDKADIEIHRRLYDTYTSEALRLIDLKLPMPAYQYVLRSSHSFNVLDARGAIGTAERARSFSHLRSLANQVAASWIEQRTSSSISPTVLSGSTVEDSPRALASPVDTGPSDASTLLLELGWEEMPHAEVASLERQLHKLICKSLRSNRIEFGVARVMATPRRTVVVVTCVQPIIQGEVITRWGPRLDVAYDESGDATAAAKGFANSLDLSVQDLTVETSDNGIQYLVGTIHEDDHRTSDVLPTLLPEMLQQLSFGHTMRWNTNTRVAMCRPLRWIVALYGSTEVSFTYADILSGRETRGLRYSANRVITIKSAGEFERTMATSGITLDQEVRRQQVIDQATALAQSVGGSLDLDGDGVVVDEIVNLVEAPTAILGSFDSDFLRIPEEVLTVVMKKHQRYLPIRSSDNSLMPYFIMVANGRVDVAAVRAGNEAVLRARYNDASFFYDRDLETDLEKFLPRLERLTFDERLGSVADRSERVRQLAVRISKLLDLDRNTVATVDRAGRLCKADLATNLVTEFTGLAGYMGSVYAQASGESADVTMAIFESVLPRYAGDELPTSTAGRILSLADNADAIVGLFAIGMRPTGSSDPYALRRAASGLVQVLFSEDLALDWLLHASAALQPVEVSEATIQSCVEFISIRLENQLVSRGVETDVHQALYPLYNHPYLALRRGRELMQLVSDMRFNDALRSYTRASRLGRQAASSTHIAPQLFSYVAERELWTAIQDTPDRPINLDEFLNIMQPLIDPIDRFFEEVLVMDDDSALRQNRLALLARIHRLGPPMISWDDVPEIRPSVE